MTVTPFKKFLLNQQFSGLTLLQLVPPTKEPTGAEDADGFIGNIIGYDLGSSPVRLEQAQTNMEPTNG